MGTGGHNIQLSVLAVMTTIDVMRDRYVVWQASFSVLSLFFCVPLHSVICGSGSGRREGQPVCRS
eukprot:scaffold21419_cov112-Isochrysis_galbana.AAC.2